MRIVAALGGNALLRRGERPEASLQQKHVERAVAALMPVLSEHEVVVTHGNGPQVGLLAAQSSADPGLRCPYPLDVLGAQTQGMIGHWITVALRNACPGRQVVGLLDHALVEAQDPALSRPTKPVGPVLTAAGAERLAGRHGWSFVEEPTGWRRAVPSPEPVDLLEAEVVTRLLADGVLVCCAGGGGVPVTRADGGRLRGVEGVVDKDLASALLAQRVRADLLLVLTDVPGVVADYGTPEARVLPTLGRADVPALALPEGSMGPKVEAALRFAERTGGRAVIGDVEDASALVSGSAGTQVSPA